MMTKSVADRFVDSLASSSHLHLGTDRQELVVIGNHREVNLSCDGKGDRSMDHVVDQAHDHEHHQVSEGTTSHNRTNMPSRRNNPPTNNQMAGSSVKKV